MDKNSYPHQQVAEEVRRQKERASRREFLKSAAGTAGGLALGLQLVAQGDEAPAADAQELLVDVPAKLLEDVGAFAVVKTANDRVIIARTDETTLVACSSVCTHKGCDVDYEAASKQMVCPCHGARYDLDGKVVQGPAKRNLKPYNARIALGLKPKA